MAQVDYFLKLEGVDGESQDDKHKNEIDISTVSWGVVNAGAGAYGTGSGAGKAQFQDIHITKLTDKASAILLLNCATGKHHGSATLCFRKAGENPVEYLKIKLTEVTVSSFQGSGHGGSGGMSEESISLNFSKIEVTYTPQAADGTSLGQVIAGYDVKANKKV